MAADDLATALIAIDEDETLCEEVAEGSLGSLGEARLSDEERTLLVDAAKELSADVQGFSANSSFVSASVHAAEGPLSPTIAPRFDGMLKRNFGGNIRSMADHNWAYV